MDKRDEMNNSGLEALSEKEKEMLKLFDSLDVNGKIAAIHSFYTLACNDLLEAEYEEAQCNK